MQVVKCKNNHFVDGDKYSVCPQCGAALANLDNKKNSKPQEVTTRSQPESIPVPQSEDAQGTVSIWEADRRGSEPAPVSAPAVEEKTVVEPVSKSTDKPQNEVQGTGSLQQEILNASANNEGKTVGIWMGSKQDSPNVQQAGISGNRLVPSDFIAGFLICIGGPHFHECYAVCYGRNSIGRGSDNDICLVNDNTVSREEQGWILYDNLNGKFYIESGHTKVPMYVNDEILLSNLELTDRAKICIGNTKMLFIKLCGDDFNWEEYSEK